MADLGKIFLKNGLEFARSYECVTSEEKRRGHSNDKGFRGVNVAMTISEGDMDRGTGISLP